VCLVTIPSAFEINNIGRQQGLPSAVVVRQSRSSNANGGYCTSNGTANSIPNERFVAKIEQHGVMLILESFAEHIIAPALWLFVVRGSDDERCGIDEGPAFYAMSSADTNSTARQVQSAS
jgi:hypothetical protein